MRFQLVNWFPAWRGFYCFKWHKAMKKLGIDKVQLVWWWKLPCLKWWAFPISYKKQDVFKGKPIFWGLYLGIVEIRVFPTRKGERNHAAAIEET